MNLKPKAVLTEKEVNDGLKLVIVDGLASEAMNALISGAFLVAFALLLGASNFQIGLLAGLPTFTNIFQLISIWLVRRYNNRRAVSVFCSIIARTPLIITGALVLIYPNTSISLLIFFLFFYYLFASIAGPSWNSWMKDLVPEKRLGTFFAKRTSLMQITNVVLSLIMAFVIDYIKDHYPANGALRTYAWMFVAGGIIGLTGVLFLSRTPEHSSVLERENIFTMLKRPLKDGNFRSLLLFNSAWVFAINLAIPFFTVYMMKSIGLSISYVIGFTVLSQITGIIAVRFWGIFADRYSNKTIIAIGAPLYITVIIAWCFVGIYTHLYANLILLAVIHIFMGIATSGINLSLTNIGLKLAPNNMAIVYLSAKNIITAFFSSVAPLVGGILADFFERRHISIDAQYAGPRVNKVFHLLSLHEWNFLFLIGALLAIVALQLLVQVKESGEVEKSVVVRIMRSSLRNNLKDNFITGNLLHWHDQLWSLVRKKPVADKTSTH